MQSTQSTGSATETRARAHRMTLDDLARMDAAELARLYAGGVVPDHLRALDGDVPGRMLAVRLLDRGPIARLLAAISGSRLFPWAGKSFTAKDASHGKGNNRVHLWGTHRLFPFETSIGKSALDGAAAVIFNYDLADNPPLIRGVHDEVREVAPGLFLGPMCLKRRSGPPIAALWFAVDAGAP